KSTRPGVYKCRPCEKPFSVTVRTVFEDSHVPLHKWVYASHLLTSSKKGISSHQLMRMLDVSYKTAWFMSHRIREAMKPLAPIPMGGEGKVIEADETYYGKPEAPYVSPRREKEGRPYKIQKQNTRVVFALVERGGSVRSFQIDRATQETIAAIVRTNASRASHLHTDESKLYVK